MLQLRCHNDEKLNLDSFQLSARTDPPEADAAPTSAP
jgi:hypothetical protein